MSSTFLTRDHLFLRAPDGGVEDLQTMAEAGFGAVFCNVGDYPPERWTSVRDRALAWGVRCGPWLRTAVGGTGEFDEQRLRYLVELADEWGAKPFIVNSESELKGSGGELTALIAEVCGDRDWALSMEPWPFSNVDWSPIDVPVLPQVFGPQWGADLDDVIAEWQRVGVSCVVPTFGTYSGWQPELYARLSPFGLYTADDCGNAFAKWSSVGTFQPCADAPEPPTPEEPVTKIGTQHGVTSAMNRLRTLDPAGTLLVADAGKWPPLSSLTQPLDQWKAYDKLERSLTILVQDHDAELEL